MHQCKSANCINARVQNDPMQYGNLTQPLPEITTKNSTEITSDISKNPSIIPSEQLAQKNNNGRLDFLNTTWKGGKTDESKKTYKEYLEILRSNIGYYEHLEVGNKFRAENINEILTVLADVMTLDDNDTIKINQNNIRAKEVRERYLNLEHGHIEHLIEVLKTHDTEVRNIRAFILTAAYNVLSTIDSYYTNKVAYDTRHW